MNTAPRPWYREPWPWILMAGPAVVIVAGVITTWLAVDSFDGLVEDDYYKQGLAVNQRTARSQQAGQMGVRADLMTGGADATRLRILLTVDSGAPLPESLQLRLVHPTRNGLDQRIALRAEGGGFYSGQLDAPLAGRWHVALEDAGLAWRLTGDWDIEKQPSLRLLPAAAGEESINKGS